MNMPLFRPGSPSRQRQRGFTLLELMVTLGIVAILTAIAYPSYVSHLVKGRRAAAQVFLMDIAQAQQQYFLDARSYTTSLTTLNLSVPSDVSPYYSISMSISSTPPTFTLTATPITGSSQASDGALSLNSAGVKTSSNNTW